MLHATACLGHASHHTVQAADMRKGLPKRGDELKVAVIGAVLLLPMSGMVFMSLVWSPPSLWCVLPSENESRKYCGKRFRQALTQL